MIYARRLLSISPSSLGSFIFEGWASHVVLLFFFLNLCLVGMQTASPLGLLSQCLALWFSYSNCTERLGW